MKWRGPGTGGRFSRGGAGAGAPLRCSGARGGKGSDDVASRAGRAAALRGSRRGFRSSLDGSRAGFARTAPQHVPSLARSADSPVQPVRFISESADTIERPADVSTNDVRYFSLSISRHHGPICPFFRWASGHSGRVGNVAGQLLPVRPPSEGRGRSLRLPGPSARLAGASHRDPR